MFEGLSVWREAYVNGYWDELTFFVRSLFNFTFKTNPYMERGILTGITRVSKESIFSDLNNLEIVTTTSRKYETAFGFTETEVETALREFSLLDQMDQVRSWYDGFRFGAREDIYNPWSITKYLDSGQFEEKDYDALLLARGISRDRIRHYGFAFAGKKVLIGR